MTQPEEPVLSEYVVTIDQDLDYTFLLTEEHAAGLPAATNPTPVEKPVISALTPATAEVGSPEFILSITGSGFSSISSVVWNGGLEDSMFVSETELAMHVDPTTASGPWTIPVQVITASETSDPADFAFTDPVPPEE